MGKNIFLRIGCGAIACLGVWILATLTLRPMAQAEVDLSTGLTPTNILWANRIFFSLGCSFVIIGFEGLLKFTGHRIPLLLYVAGLASFLIVFGCVPAIWLLAL